MNLHRDPRFAALGSTSISNMGKKGAGKPMNVRFFIVAGVAVLLLIFMYRSAVQTATAAHKEIRLLREQASKGHKMESELESCRVESIKLEGKLGELNSYSDKVEKDLIAAKNRLSTTADMNRKEADDLTNKIAELNKEIESHKETGNKGAAKIKALMALIDQKNQLNEAAQEKNTRLEAKVSEIEEKNDGLQDQVGQLTEKLESLEGQLEHLRAEKTKIEHVVSELRDELLEIGEHQDHIHSRIKQLKNEDGKQVDAQTEE